jgi:RNA polymerase sigma factor (sigma-70 family)
MATGFTRVLAHLQQSGGGLSDGQLLARFVAARDEASFATLVRRHGPMVLGVCRRVLHDFHDAEDAFQATFLVLARKAASVVKGESVGCWLHGVAYRTALEARSLSARRRARERPMNALPHPHVQPSEAEEWRPLLDRELSRLPEKFRTALVLCDLEGQSRRDAARQLGVPEGTLSSRLAAGRKLLAKRLTGCGLAPSAGALACALAPGTASAQVPAALVTSTARIAALAAAGQLAAAPAPAVVLMKGVMKAMLLKKLRLTVGAVMVLAALGMCGIAYWVGGLSGVAQAAPPDKPVNELEALRKENELLKLNLQIVLEKVRTQEGELQTMRKEVAAKDAARQVPFAPFQYNAYTTAFRPLAAYPDLSAYQLMSTLNNPAITAYPNVSPYTTFDVSRILLNGVHVETTPSQANAGSDPIKEAECAVKALREAKDKEAKKRAAEALDGAMKKLKEQLK